MGNINWGRVLLGGIVAGVVVNVVEFTLHVVILDPDWKAAMAALGRSPDESTGAMMIYVGLGFLIGILAVCYYAAIRPPFGAGPKTAVFAGLGVWALTYLFPTIGMVPSGLFPNRLLWLPVVVGIVELPLATMVGAWLYKED